jgi:hypothetical protein
MRISQKALQLIVGIDFEQLKEQKLKLLGVQGSLKAMGVKDDVHDALTGITHLIDSLQDFAVDVMGKDENDVFQFEDNPDSPQGEKVYDEEQEWNVPVCRIGYGHALMAVSARSESEAIEKAIDEAGGELFSEKSSEYTAPDGAHLITDQNK